MNPENFSESGNGLQSQFAVLRALPILGRRELLPGLRARHFFARSALALGPMLFPLAFILCAMPIFLFIAIINPQGQQPKRERASARVLQIEAINDTPGERVNAQIAAQKMYFVKYRFETNGRVYQSTALASNDSANAADYAALKVGDELSVTYLAGNPSRSGLQPLGGNSEFPPILMLIFPLFALMFFVPIVAPTLRLWWRAQCLAQHGQLCNGRIVWIKSPPALGAGFGEFEVHYEFSAEGELHSGKMRCNNLWLVQHLPPHAPIVVAYDAARPQNSVFLEPFVA